MIVCLCGSTRFYKHFVEMNRRQTMAGHIVLAPGVFGHTIHAEYLISDEDKARLDGLHLEKIAMADKVIVIAPNGYVGESTRREIEKAEELGKEVEYYYPNPAPAFRLLIDGHLPTRKPWHWR